MLIPVNPDPIFHTPKTGTPKVRKVGGGPEQHTRGVFPGGLAAHGGGGQLIVTDDKPEVVHARLLNRDGLLPGECHGVVVLKVNVQHLGPAVFLLLQWQQQICQQKLPSLNI